MVELLGMFFWLVGSIYFNTGCNTRVWVLTLKKWPCLYVSFVSFGIVGIVPLLLLAKNKHFCDVVLSHMSLAH